MRRVGNYRDVSQGSLSRALQQRCDVQRLLPIMLVLLSMWFLSGCVVTPIEAQDGSTPGGSSATIAIAPISGEPGDTIFVSGAGWASNESVYVNLEQTPDQEAIQTTVAIVNTDDEGRFTVTFTYPVDPIWREPGTIDVVAYALGTGARAIAPFEVLASAPPSDATATPIAADATATPTTAAGSATATSTPIAQPGNIGVVVSHALNVRAGPSTVFAILRSISRGTEFTVLGQNNSGAWLFVRLSGGLEGWLARAYTNYSGIAPVVPSPKPPSPTPYPTSTRPPEGSGWRGEYYNNAHLSGDADLVRDDAKIDFDWGYGAPAYAINGDYFSVRWVRSFYLSEGTYRFYAKADDGVRVWVNGELIIDEWDLASGQTYSVVKRVDSGSTLVRVEFYDVTQIAYIHVWWERTEQNEFPDWRGEYYDNRDLNGAPKFVRNDTAVDFDWGTGGPSNNFKTDNFSVRWTREIHFEAGTYRFHATTDDGMRVYLDDALIVDEWRNGSAREITRDIYLGYGPHRLRVEYFEEGSRAVARLWWERLDDHADNYPDWKGEYWENRTLDGSPRVTRNDHEIDFNWGSGSPDSRIPDDYFSARWTRWVDFDDARYRFHVKSDDGVRVWVGDDRIINEWHDNSSNNTYTAEIDLDGDERVTVEYYERTGGAQIEVWWEKIGSSPTSTPSRDEPYVNVVPSQGPTGTQVRVSGGGFPDRTNVNLYLGGLVQASSIQASNAEVRASTQTDDDGEFSMTFNIPNNWPDGSPVEPGKLVVLVATNDFGVEASGIFEVTSPPVSGGNAYAQVSPSSGYAGTDVTVRGGGFPPNTRVRAYLAGLVSVSSLTNDDDMKVYDSEQTDAQGNYVLNFEIPDEWPDGDDLETGKIMILVATDNFGVTASTDFDFFKDGEEPNPYIDVSPNNVVAGSSVRISGGGFPVASTVNIYLGSLDSQEGGDAGDRLYATTNTDRNGNYDTAFTMPSKWPNGRSIASGRIAVVAANRDFSYVTGGSINFTASGAPADTPTPTSTVANPTPTRAPSANASPDSGGKGTRVTMSGSGFPANVTVNAHLAKFGGNGGLASDAASYGTATTDGNGNYSFSFTMPEDWPDGKRIDDGRLLIVIATNDFGRQASAVFRYNAASAAGELATVAPSPTLVPTGTPIPTATEAPVATAVPTATPTSLATSTAAPTATEVPPTNTPEPTATEVLPTNTPEPTATDVPPTNTPEPTEEPPATEVPTEVPTEVVEEPPAQQEITEPVEEEPPATATATEVPTAVPTEEPTEVPTEVPTTEPTAEPTEEPTEVPTEEPTAPPVEEPPAEGQGSSS